jgi:uncharacterized membrane protein YjjP (DUF1212 family)
LPAHRLETVVGEISKKLGVRGHFFVVPTGIFGSVEKGGFQQNYFIRVQPGEVNLEKQVLVDAIASELFGDRITVAQAAKRIDALKDLPSRYPAWLEGLSLIVVAATAAVFFGGNWKECLTSALIGLLSFGLLRLTALWQGLGRLFSFAVAFVAGLTAGAMGAVLGPLAHFTCILAGLIVFVPGLSFTIAMTELATSHLVAGTSRLAGAVVTFFQIGFGVALANYVSKWLWTSPPSVVLTDSFTLPIVGACLVLAGCAFVVLFKARPKDAWGIVAVCFLAYFGARITSSLMGNELGASLAALAVGLFANGFSRWLNQPNSILLLPGLLLLVPGSMGFRSLNAMLNEDIIGGLHTAISMVMVAVALVSGLFVSALILSPRRAL